MNKKLLFGTLLSLSVCYGQAQFSFNDVEFWIGSGSDSTVLIASFNNGASDSSYAWGYLFNPGEDGEDLLNAVAAADENFSINAAGGFLNDVIYHRHEGIGGSPDYWSTWSGADTASLMMNSGIGEPLVDGEWFAISYTDFNPALKPALPIPAFNPNAFDFSMVNTWVGSGSDSAVMIIDFQLAGDTARLSYGILFNDSIQASQILSDLDQADAQLTVNAGSFLNDISYGSWQGIGGSPDYWSTWSGTNIGDWFLNAGIGTWLKSGELFGCSYTDFAPALRPKTPNQEQSIHLIEFPEIQLSLFPNPAHDILHLALEQEKEMEIVNALGQSIWKASFEGDLELVVSDWPRGAYFIRSGNSSKAFILH